MHFSSTFVTFLSHALLFFSLFCFYVCFFALPVCLVYLYLPQGRTELHDAVERGDIVAVKELLKTPNKINCRTERVSWKITKYFLRPVFQ